MFRLNEKAGKFQYIASDEKFKEDIELPDRVVCVNNGAFDLEQKGLSGFYVWLGYRHDDSGSVESSMKSVLQRTAHTIGKWLQGQNGIKYEIDDYWKEFEMFRVWAGREESVEESFVVVERELHVPGTDIILEAGDKIRFREFMKHSGSVSASGSGYSVHIGTKNPDDNVDNIDFADFTQHVRDLAARGYVFKRDGKTFSSSAVLSDLKNTDGSYDVWVVK